MYKWHVQSAIGRGRPAIHDFAKVADGIAASLRQFSISTSRAAEDGKEGSYAPSRSLRQKAAVNDLSSLAPAPSRGIDARSLAAKPSFTITRADPMPRSTGNYQGGGGGGRGRGGARRSGGRSVRSNRGRGNGGGRGRGRGGKREIRKSQEQEDEEEMAWTESEEAVLDEVYGGGSEHPYVPTTSAETLSRLGPAVITSPRGIVETLARKFEVATGTQGPGTWTQAAVHQLNIQEGRGTFFETNEQRILAIGDKGEDEKFSTLPQEEKDEIERQWAAGRYDGPKFAVKEDVIGLVESYTRRNDTYLPEDARKLEDKLRSLIPPAFIKPKAPGAPPNPPKAP